MTILITRHDKIGDFVTMLPVCKVLKEQRKANIVMLVSKVNVQLAQKLEFVDEVIEYSDDSFTLLNRLSKFKFDASISGYIDFHLGLCLFLAKIPIRIAPATKLAQIFFNKKVKQRRSKVEKTEWQYNLDLAKAYDDSLELKFDTPLVKLQPSIANMKPFIILHPGFGGSSDGNLTLDDYINLAKKATSKVEVVFSFGPDDNEAKEYISSQITNNKLPITIRDDFSTLWDFMIFISLSKLFVSTSTGPMHLAGLTNTKTMSFFGENLFASSKRWSTISDIKYQNNYEVPQNYGKDFYDKIEYKFMEIIDEI